MSWLNYIAAKKVVSAGLKLTFDSILNVPVADPSDVAQWNTFFDLPTNGTAFTSVVVIGNDVELIGGLNINFKDALFDNSYSPHLLRINDYSNCVVSLGYGSLSDVINEIGCPNVVEINLPALVTMGDYNFNNLLYLTTLSLPSLITCGQVAFANTAIVTIDLPLLESAGYSFISYNNYLISINVQSLTVFGNNSFCSNSSLPELNLPSLITPLNDLGNSSISYLTSLTALYMPIIETLGVTVLQNGLFQGMAGQTITLTVPSALMTCNGGLPDGDIQYLQANNTVTIITV